MKITLISPTPEDISAFGTRALSAYLKRAGYEVRTIFLPGSHKRFTPGGSFVYRYTARVLDEIGELATDSQLIGISFMTYFFDRAVQLTEALKKRTNAPVIWGGIHATVCPEEALQHADMVCVGEGEDSLLEIVQRLEKGQDLTATRNIWLKRNNHIITNPLRPLIRNLDTLPFLDFDLDGHFCYDHLCDNIRQMDNDFFKSMLPLRPDLNGNLQVCYRTMTDRGCPHKCSYCSVSVQKKLYKGDCFFRKRSVKNVISELKNVKEKFPFIEAIQFFDDTFFSRSSSDIQHFGALYKEQIALPFHAQCSPATITEKKLEHLIDAGLIYTEMGLQTGSRQVRKMYNRKESNEEIIKAARIINTYKQRLLVPDYHVILDNPWETEHDTLETLHLILQIPRPFCLKLSTLQYFPGTELYVKGKEEGLLADDIRQIYRVPFLAPQNRYVDFLIYLATFQTMPGSLLNLLASPSGVRLLNRKSLQPLYHVACITLEKVRLLGKGIEALAKGDFQRILRYLRRIR